MKTLNETMPMIGFFSIVATVIASVMVRNMMGGGDLATLASLTMVIASVFLFFGAWKLVDDRAKLATQTPEEPDQLQ